MHDNLLAFSRDIRDKIIQNLEQEMHLKKEEVVSKGLQANSLSDSKSKTYEKVHILLRYYSWTFLLNSNYVLV